MAVFRWSRRPTNQLGDTWVPLAEVHLRMAEGTYQAFALEVDSGAVISLLRRSVADILGLELEDGEPVDLGGVGGTRTNAFVHVIDTRIGDGIQYPIPYAIADSETVPNLLGRKGVFDTLQVDFDATLDETRISAPWLDGADRRIWDAFTQISERIERSWDEAPIAQPGKLVMAHLFTRASRVFASVAGMMKLHRTIEAPTLLRALFEVSVQFEFLILDVQSRAQDYADFAKISHWKAVQELMREPVGPHAQAVLSSPLRPSAEPRIRSEYEAIRDRFKRDNGRLFDRWYRMDFRSLCSVVGRGQEYRSFYKWFCYWVHSDPDQSRVNLDPAPSTVFMLALAWYGRVAHGMVEKGRIVLTHDENESLQYLRRNLA